MYVIQAIQNHCEVVHKSLIYCTLCALNINTGHLPRLKQRLENCPSMALQREPTNGMFSNIQYGGHYSVQHEIPKCIFYA